MKRLKLAEAPQLTNAYTTRAEILGKVVRTTLIGSIASSIVELYRLTHKDNPDFTAGVIWELTAEELGSKVYVDFQIHDSYALDGDAPLYDRKPIKDYVAYLDGGFYVTDEYGNEYDANDLPTDTLLRLAQTLEVRAREKMSA